MKYLLLIVALMFALFCHTANAFELNRENFEIQVDDWDNDGSQDLLLVKKKGESSTTELHVLSGNSGFKEFILHTPTALHVTGNSWKFIAADWNFDGKKDLIAINKGGNANNKMEVHVLNGASVFQDFLVRAELPHNAYADADFIMIPKERDLPNLAMVIPRGATGNVEVHEFSRDLTHFVGHLPTGMGPPTNLKQASYDVCDFNGDGHLDFSVCCIEKSKVTGNPVVEHHVFTGTDNFKTGICHKAIEKPEDMSIASEFWAVFNNCGPLLAGLGVFIASPPTTPLIMGLSVSLASHSTVMCSISVVDFMNKAHKLYNGGTSSGSTNRGNTDRSDQHGKHTGGGNNEPKSPSTPTSPKSPSGPLRDPEPDVRPGPSPGQSDFPIG